MSTEIQRYEIYGENAVQVPIKGGDYVLFSDHEKALAEQKSRTEVELVRGEQWCADFIAMRKERDQLQSALVEAKEEIDRRQCNWNSEYDKHSTLIIDAKEAAEKLAEVAVERDNARAQNEANFRSWAEMLECNRALAEERDRLKAELADYKDEADYLRKVGQASL